MQLLSLPSTPAHTPTLVIPSKPTSHLISLTINNSQASITNLIDCCLLPEYLSEWISQHTSQSLKLFRDTKNPRPDQPQLTLIIHLETKKVCIPLIRKTKKGYWKIRDNKDYWVLQYWLGNLNRGDGLRGISQAEYEGFSKGSQKKSLEQSFSEISIDTKLTAGQIETSKGNVKLEPSVADDEQVLGDKKSFDQMVSDYDEKLSSQIDDGPKSEKKKKVEDISGLEDDTGIEKFFEIDVPDSYE
jgi:hypothetical protein